MEYSDHSQEALVIDRPWLTKKNAGIAIIVVTFLATTVASVVEQAPTAWFVVMLTLFSILVIALAPWVLGN